MGQSDLPQRTALVSQYPNPFNPVTRIVFDLKAQGPVQIGVYDVRGQCVATLVSGIMDGGRP